VADTAG